MAEDEPSGNLPTGAPPTRLAIWVVALLCFTGMFLSLYGLFFYAIPDQNRELIAILVGAFTTNAGAIVTAIVRLRVGKDSQ
jgi:hypothetical protein